MVAGCGSTSSTEPAVGKVKPEPRTVVQQVARGLGTVEHLSPERRRAFAFTEHFAPLPTPGPDDWLSWHPEPGQTVAQYVESRPNRPEPPRDQIYIQPIGPLPAERGPTPDELADYARRFFDREVTVLPALDPEALDLERRIHDGRAQLQAARLLDRLGEDLPHDAYCLIAVTLEDLYPAEDFNFVFGLARLKARTGVFSFARYHPGFFGERGAVERRVVVRRALKVMSHEVGHMFGLEHCTHLHCNMNGFNHTAELDRTPAHLCPVCLRKLDIAVGLQPAARYQELAEVYQVLGLEEEATWAAERRRYLNSVGPGL